MRFRKPWLRVKLVNFEFSVKSSRTDYSCNVSNKSNLKSLAHIGTEKSLVELGVLKNEIFHFFHMFRSIKKFTFSP